MIRIKDIADRAGVRPDDGFECNTRKDRARLKGDGRENQPDFKGDGVRAEYQRAHAAEQQLQCLLVWRLVS